MGVVESVLDAAQRGIDGLWPELNERQRRRLLGVEARELGWGGVSALARAVGVSRSTVAKGLADLDAPESLPAGWSRRAGGGRKRLTDNDPGLAGGLGALGGPGARGAPGAPLRGACKAAPELAGGVAGGGSTGGGR